MPAARGCSRGLEARVVRCSSRGVAGESARALGFSRAKARWNEQCRKSASKQQSFADRGIGAAGRGRVLVVALMSRAWGRAQRRPV
eukprot:6735592-Prymnesium_polylepis.2